MVEISLKKRSCVRDWKKTESKNMERDATPTTKFHCPGQTNQLLNYLIAQANQLPDTANIDNNPLTKKTEENLINICKKVALKASAEKYVFLKNKHKSFSEEFCIF